MKRLACALILVAAAGAGDDELSPADETRRAEARISQWNAAEEDRYSPPSCIRAKAFQLEGQWKSGTRWAGCDLVFTPKGRRQFDVVFATRISLIDTEEGWTVKRTARLQGGAVVLSRAVEDIGAMYSRLWPLEVGPYRTVALVPSAVLGDVRRAYEAGGCTYFNATFECRDCFERRPATGSGR